MGSPRCWAAATGVQGGIREPGRGHQDGEKTQVAWAGIFEGEEQAGGEGEEGG